METYPIMIDEELAGKLTVDRQGARTAFEAECRMLPGLIRISAYGGGKEGYLGVLAPDGEKLRLRKTLSRAQLREFPAEIESVERAGLDRKAATMADKGAAGEPPVQEIGSAHGDAPGAEETEAATEGEPAQETLPARPEEEPPPGLNWYASPDGALVCFDGTQTLIALPLNDERIPADIPGEKRMVEGRKYLVFRTKNGRIIR